jgi:hypothetical protein
MIIAQRSGLLPLQTRPLGALLVRDDKRKAIHESHRDLGPALRARRLDEITYLAVGAWAGRRAVICRHVL